MERAERGEQSAEQLRKEAEESIDRIRWEFERLAEWILAHRVPKERGNQMGDE
jgi:hypothetical protein